MVAAVINATERITFREGALVVQFLEEMLANGLAGLDFYRDDAVALANQQFEFVASLVPPKIEIGALPLNEAIFEEHVDDEVLKE